VCSSDLYGAGASWRCKQ